METTITIFFRNGHYGVDGERFDNTPVGLNQLYSAVMKRVMDFDRMVQESGDKRTNYHQAVSRGEAKPMNREDFYAELV